MVLAGLLGALLLRRRRRRPHHGAAENDVAAPALATPGPSQPATLEPSAPEAPASLPYEDRSHPIEMQLEARHLSRALVNATLAYRLTLSNRSAAPTGPLRIAGDIVSAHASLSAEEQLAPGEAALATIHELSALAPGESVILSGELSLPIASILPIRSGGSRVFVPLTRFRAETPGHAATTRVFVIGQAGERPGGALRPFPLDRGPGIDRGLDQRDLGSPA